MRVVQHAALHVQQQHIVWQQIFIKLKDTFPTTLCQRVVVLKIRCIILKKVIHGNPELLRFYYGFAAASPISVAVLMESSLGQPLSR